MTNALQPYARRSAETWAAARADYLSGGSAAEVCERHGLSLSTFHWRARTEGWRRADQPEGGSPFAPLDDYELGRIDRGLPLNAADMARLAWSNAGAALRDGRLIEARGWTRLHYDLAAMAEGDDLNRRVYLRWAATPEMADKIPATPPLRPVEED